MNRSLRIISSKSDNTLILADIKGRIHKYDTDLKLLASSPVTSYTQPINNIVCDDKYVFTKDRSGNIAKWSLETLRPLNILDSNQCVDRKKTIENEVPSLSPNRGIALHKSCLYTNNGFVQLVKIDIESFDVLDIRDNPSQVFLDWISTENPNCHAVADVRGHVHFGDLETNTFRYGLQSDGDISHKIVWDRKHNRFLATQDAGRGTERFVSSGVISFNEKGEEIEEFKISIEDNEFLEFSPDHETFYVGGFNGSVFVFDNSEKKLTLKRRLGPFNFQCNSMAVSQNNELFVLLQTGEVVKLDEWGHELGRLNPAPGCFWNFEADRFCKSRFYAGTDEGVSVFSMNKGCFGLANLKIEKQIDHGFGVTKDVKQNIKGNYICISRSGYIISIDPQGNIHWYKKIPGIPRGISLDDEGIKGIVCTDDGVVREFDTVTGETLNEKNFDSAVYCVGYDSKGNIILSTNRDQLVHVYSPNFSEKIGEIPFDRRMKRFIKTENNKMFISSGSGLEEIDTENFKILNSYNECMHSGKENGTLHNGYVYVGGYGYQLGTYDYATAEIVDLEEFLPDFSKALICLEVESDHYLLVGGRSNYVNIYKIVEGIPHKQRELYF